MSARRALVGGLVLVLAAAASRDGAAHTGGSTGYASLSIEGAAIRYALVLWPAALPPPIAEELQRSAPTMPRRATACWPCFGPRSRSPPMDNAVRHEWRRSHPPRPRA